MNTPSVIQSVVNSDLCIGCGLCVYKCPTQALEMNWNDFGFLVPKLSGNCDLNGECLKVCPFNPSPEEKVNTENELADKFLTGNQKTNLKIGKYIGLYAGFSNEFRLTSSSGGIATYLFKELLERSIVNHIFSVTESKHDKGSYEYSIISSKEELVAASKTKYYPVTLGTVMSKIHQLEGRVAIVGVACFIKAIRLVQYYEPGLTEKIPFLIGIICGGVKSRFFTEYLASKAGVAPHNIMHPQFRIKDVKSTAGDYSFGCVNQEDNKEHIIKMRIVGDMWGTGMFKNNACDFCDDVTTELADISLGDAWLPPYNKDGAGTNVIVTRSPLSDEIIQAGIKKGDINIEILALERFIASQQGSFNHRHTGLNFRILRFHKGKESVAPKRHLNYKISLAYKLVQIHRLRLRQKSLEIWQKHGNIEAFSMNLKQELRYLAFWTRVYHLEHKIREKLKLMLKKNDNFSI